jgi:hypothetical protein
MDSLMLGSLAGRGSKKSDLRGYCSMYKNIMLKKIMLWLDNFTYGSGEFRVKIGVKED